MHHKGGDNTRSARSVWSLTTAETFRIPSSCQAGKNIKQAHKTKINPTFGQATNNTATISNSRQERDGGEGNRRKEKKKTSILHMCVGMWGMCVFKHVHKTTNTMKLEKTLECTGSGVEVSEAVSAVAKCKRKLQKEYLF